MDARANQPGKHGSWLPNAGKVDQTMTLEQKMYDIIFIDGNHTAPYVMMDSVMSWPLLKKGEVAKNYKFQGFGGGDLGGGGAGDTADVIIIKK